MPDKAYQIAASDVHFIVLCTDLGFAPLGPGARVHLVSVSNGGRASSAASSRSDVQSGREEELVPDDMLLDEFKI